MAVLYLGSRSVYRTVLSWWGMEPFAYPFVDTESVLLGFDCWRQGIDVWTPSACMRGGYYTYSPFLLHLSTLPLDIGDRVPLGILVALAFLLSLTALPPAATHGELAVRILAVLSSACAFALERANLDVVIFLLTVAGVCLALRRDGWRHLGYAVFVLAALMKFYPAVLLLLAVRERPRITLTMVMVAVVTVVGLLAPLTGGARVTPVGSPYNDMFGAMNLPFGLFVVPILPPGDSWDGLRAPLPAPAIALLAALVVTAILIAWRNLRRDSAALALLDPGRVAFLVAGAVVICGCFFAAQNVAYRAIFLLMVLPGLFALTGGPSRAYVGLIAAILFLMWAELFRRLVVGALPIQFEVGFWWFREAVWWWTISRLLGLLGAFFLTSETIAGLRRLVSRPA